MENNRSKSKTSTLPKPDQKQNYGVSYHNYYSTQSTEENRRLSAIVSGGDLRSIAPPQQLGLFDRTKEETPAFQFCSFQVEKDTELEVIATERGFRLHWQKEPIGIHLTHSEAIALAECLQPKIDNALAKGKGIDFKDQHWRQIHTSLLEKILQGRCPEPVEGGEG